MFLIQDVVPDNFEMVELLYNEGNGSLKFEEPLS